MHFCVQSGLVIIHHYVLKVAAAPPPSYSECIELSPDLIETLKSSRVIDGMSLSLKLSWKKRGEKLVVLSSLNTWPLSLCFPRVGMSTQQLNSCFWTLKCFDWLHFFFILSPLPFHFLSLKTERLFLSSLVLFSQLPRTPPPYTPVFVPVCSPVSEPFIYRLPPIHLFSMDLSCKDLTLSGDARSWKPYF